jgi:hypothetical protein
VALRPAHMNEHLSASVSLFVLETKLTLFNKIRKRKYPVQGQNSAIISFLLFPFLFSYFVQPWTTVSGGLKTCRVMSPPCVISEDRLRLLPLTAEGIKSSVPSRPQGASSHGPISISRTLVLVAFPGYRTIDPLSADPNCKIRICPLCCYCFIN